MCRESLCPKQVLPALACRLASCQKALPFLHRSYGLMRQTITLLLPSASAWSAGLCRLPQTPAGKWPFPALSLQSLHGCLDPYLAVFPRRICPFLPGERRPHVRSETFGTPIYSHIATSVGHAFRGCSHSVMFRPPCSLDPPVAPTAENSQGGRAVYTTQWTCGYPHGLWYRYMPESGNWHGGTLTR